MINRKLSYRRLTVALVLLLGLASSLHARFGIAPADRAAAAARDVVLASCTGQVVNQPPGKGQLVYTTSSFQVVKNLKEGGLPASFSLRVVGGQVGKLKVTVADAPVFQAGRHYVLFLKPAGPDGKGLLVCGAASGALPARQNASGQWEVLLPGGPARTDSAARLQAAGTAAAGWVGLEAFQASLAKGGVK